MTNKTRIKLWPLAGAVFALFLAGQVARAVAGQVVIVKPQVEETIHDNSGHVEVAVNVDAQQGLAAGEHLRLLLDGKPAGKDHRGLAAALDGVVRGTHTLQALVVDRSGTVVAQSDPVTFHMWRASRLFPNRR